MFWLGDPRAVASRTFVAHVLIAFATAAALSGCERQDSAPVADDSDVDVLHVSDDVAEVLRGLDLPTNSATDSTNRFFANADAAHFGQYLFFEESFSASGTTSCATCHQPSRMFTDGLPVAQAEGTGTRNTPSILNTAHFPWLNWDGSADTLWMQAMRPFEAEHELDSTRTTIAKLMGTREDLRLGYESVFGALPDSGVFNRLPDRAMPGMAAWDEMSEAQRELVDGVFVNICKAIASYERILVSRDAPFDRFARAVSTGGLADWATAGNPGFGETELEGFRLFATEMDCIACHAGPYFSDFAFHSVRVPPRGGGAPVDAARFEGLNALITSPMNAAGPHSDDRQSSRARRIDFLQNPSSNWGRFRTPSLRNVDLTPPYMHAGQFDTLDAVLHHYSTFDGALPPDHHDAQERLLRPLDLSDEEKAAIIAFLRSLSAPPPAPELLEKPASAISGGKAKTGL